MKDAYGMVSVSHRGAIAIATLDRPGKLNSLTYEFWTDFHDLLADATVDSAVRAVVLRGEGSCFSAGGDIAGFGGLDDIPARRRYQDAAFAAFQALENFDKPTIAAVHGFALGGGCEPTPACTG